MKESNSPKKPLVIREEGQEAPTIYVNNVEIRATEWDIHLSMGEVTRRSEGEMRVKELVKIYMSPQHAKVFARVLTNQVARYEEAVGTIPIEAEKLVIETE